MIGKNKKLQEKSTSSKKLVESSKFICGTCKCVLEERSIACDGCQNWFDATCQKLTDQQLSNLSQPHLKFYCDACEGNFAMFGGLLAMIACVAHVGFDRLLKFVEKLNAGNYSFENDFALEASNLTFDDVHIDFEASQI